MPKKPIKRSRPPITMTLSEEARAWLDQYAGQRGVARSSVVEMLIREHCQPNRATRPATPRYTPARPLAARTPVQAQEGASQRDDDGIERVPVEDGP